MQQSDRISRGDFNKTEVVTTRVAEVQKLASAHDRMREGLQSLSRGSCDFIPLSLALNTFKG